MYLHKSISYFFIYFEHIFILQLWLENTYWYSQHPAGNMWYFFFASSKGLIKHDIHSSETSMNFCDNMKEPGNMTWHDTLLTQHHSRSFRHQSSHYGMPVICRVPSHTAKDVIHTTNSSRHRTTGKAPLCRESFHRHSAKVCHSWNRHSANIFAKYKKIKKSVSPTCRPPLPPPVDHRRRHQPATAAILPRC